MTAIRISMVLGLTVLGILLFTGMDATTAVFRSFMVFMGIAALSMLYRYLAAVIKPPPPPPPPGDEEENY